MDLKKQERTPLLDAIKDYIKSDPIPFDVPGHKMGNFKNDFMDFVGERVYKADINAPIGLDNLYHPEGVIKESEDLCAELFGVDEALFSINGTTGGILTMIVGTVKPGQKIILPRNVHKSVINAIILVGCVPIFVSPKCDENLGISSGVTTSEYIKAMDNNLDAVAVLIINPTYFGFTSDIKAIIEAAHLRNMVVIADEAHGSHFYFHDELPLGAMQAGADIASLSLHKTLGSLTQSSVILLNKKRINYPKLLHAYSMFSSTSPSHLLLASIDSARKTMAMQGKEIMDRTLMLARYARKRLSQIQGISVVGKEYCIDDSCFDYDETKLIINVSKLEINSYEIYKRIKENYNIQLELAESNALLAICSVGTTKEHIDKLIDGINDLVQKYYHFNDEKCFKGVKVLYMNDSLLNPRNAFESESKIIRLEDSIGRVCAENIMAYPPGIPVVICGEKIENDHIERIKNVQSYGCVVLSTSPCGFIRVVDEDSKGEE